MSEGGLFQQFIVSISVPYIIKEIHKIVNMINSEKNQLNISHIDK